MRTLSQLRADFALQKVVAFYNDKDNGKKKEFKSLSSSAPSMILQNGFGQTLSFFIAKGKDHHLAIFELVREWLVSQGFATGDDYTGFLQSLTGENSTQQKYLAAQNETLSLLEWVKRYASAFFKEEA